MKNNEIYNHLCDAEDTAFERMKAGHYDAAGEAYYRGLHDMAFNMRRNMEERLRKDARELNDKLDTIIDVLGSVRKRTIGAKGRAWLDDVVKVLRGLKEPQQKGRP